MSSQTAENPNKLEFSVYGDKLFIEATLDADEFLECIIEENEELDNQYIDYCDVLGLDYDCRSALRFAKSLDGKGIYFDNARASIYCNDCGTYWDTDDSFRWYSEGCGKQDRMELQDYPGTNERPDYPERTDPAQLLLPVNLPKQPEPNTDVIWVDDKQNGHCPRCGGLLLIGT